MKKKFTKEHFKCLVRDLVVIIGILLFISYMNYVLFYRQALISIQASTRFTENYVGDIWSIQEGVKGKYLQERNYLPSKSLGKFDLTFYTPVELGAKKAEELRTATGTIPKEGRTIAVDNKLIPRGSIVYIENFGYYIAEDTGSAIKGKRIDIYLDDYEEAKQLGRQSENVYIIGTKWSK